MNTEILHKPNQYKLLKEDLAKLDEKAQIRFLQAAKDKIIKRGWKPELSAQIVFLNKELILMKNPGIDQDTANGKANIEEASRLESEVNNWKRLEKTPGVISPWLSEKMQQWSMSVSLYLKAQGELCLYRAQASQRPSPATRK